MNLNWMFWPAGTLTLRNQFGSLGGSIGPTAPSQVVAQLPSSTVLPVRKMSSPTLVGVALLTVKVTGMSLAVSTVNWMPFEAVPPLFVTVTLELPFAAEGTVATMLVSDQELMVAAVVPNLTLPAPCVAPKLRPAIVTLTPGWPTVGPTEPTSGAAAPSVNCQTATVCAGREKAATGLLPPVPDVTVMEEPPSSPVR